MNWPERWSAGAIAEAVRCGACSAVEIAHEALTRRDAYDRVQPQAWIHRTPAETLLAAAAEVDTRIAAGEHLPLAGVPFAVKDNIDVAGAPTTAASRDARRVAVTRTAPAYRLYAMAGMAPPKPALMRADGDGAAIEVEVYEMPMIHFGSFVAEVPPAASHRHGDAGRRRRGEGPRRRAARHTRRTGCHRLRRLARLSGRPG